MLKIVQKVCFPLSACVLLLKTEKKPAESRTRSVHVMIHMLCFWVTYWPLSVRFSTLKDMYWSWAWSRSSHAVISYNRFNCSPRKVNSEVWILLLLTVAALHDMLRETKRAVIPFKLTDFLLHDTNLVCGGSDEMYLLLDNNSALNRGGLGHCAASGTLHGHNFRSWSDFGVFFVFLSALVCWDRILLIFLSLQRSWYRRQIGNVTGLGLLFQSH